MVVLNNLIVAIISQFIHISNHHLVHLEYVGYMSTKFTKTGKKESYKQHEGSQTLNSTFSMIPFK